MHERTAHEQMRNPTYNPKKTNLTIAPKSDVHSCSMYSFRICTARASLKRAKHGFATSCSYRRLGSVAENGTLSCVIFPNEHCNGRADIVMHAIYTNPTKCVRQKMDHKKKTTSKRRCMHSYNPKKGYIQNPRKKRPKKQKRIRKQAQCKKAQTRIPGCARHLACSTPCTGPCCCAPFLGWHMNSSRCACRWVAHGSLHRQHRRSGIPHQRLITSSRGRLRVPGKTNKHAHTHIHTHVIQPTMHSGHIPVAVSDHVHIQKCRLVTIMKTGPNTTVFWDHSSGTSFKAKPCCALGPGCPVGSAFLGQVR